MSNRTARFYLTLIAALVLLLSSIPLRMAAQNLKDPAMSPNKRTVQAYMDAFNKTDHAAILSCLTDDVEWFIPGVFRTTGKSEFDTQIENDAFVGHPLIKVSRLTEENDVVVAEGTVSATKKDGGVLHLEFCDVFKMRGAKIKRLISYLMETKQESSKQ